MSERQIVSAVLLVAFPIFEIGCYVLLYKKRSDLSIRKRNMSMIRLASMAGWVAYLNLIISVTDGVACMLFYLTSLIVFPLSAGPQLIRSVVLWGMLEQNNILLAEEMLNMRRRRDARHGNNQQGSNSEKSNLDLSSSDLQERTGNDHEATRAKLLIVQNRMKQIVTISRWGLVLIPLGILGWALLSTSDINQLRSTDFDECLPEPDLIRNIGPGIGILVASLTLFAIALVRHCDDELGIRQEITRNVILLAGTFIVVLIVRVLGYYEWQPLLQTIQQMMLSFSMVVLPCFQRDRPRALSWIKQQKQAVPGYGRPLPDIRTNNTRASAIRRATQKDINSDKERRREMSMSLDAGLCILLSSREGIKAFSEHCAREFSVENIKFWCAVNEYHAEVDMTRAPSDDDPEILDESDLVAFGKDMYDVYIAPGAELQINVASTMCTTINKSLESGEAKRDLFDVAQKEMFSLMSRDSYPRFLASKHHNSHNLVQRKFTRRLSMIPAVPSSREERSE